MKEIIVSIRKNRVSLIKWFRREVEALRTAREARHRAEIECRFTVRERQGKIYILCNSTAWAVMPPDSTMKEALALIGRARAAAVMFDKVTGRNEHERSNNE